MCYLRGDAERLFTIDLISRQTVLEKKTKKIQVQETIHNKKQQIVVEHHYNKIIL